MYCIFYVYSWSINIHTYIESDCSLLFPEATKSGVEEFEAMEVDGDGGPGPQRCK